MQQMKLAGRQRHVVPVQADVACGRIERHTAMEDHRIGPSAPPAQKRADACAQFVQIEGLDEIVIGPGIEPGDARGRRIACAQDENRHVVLAGAQALQHFDAIDARKAQIQNDEIVHAAGRLFERIGAGPHPVDRIAFVAQAFLHSTPNQAIVFDEEQAHGSCSRGDTTVEIDRQTLTLH